MKTYQIIIECNEEIDDITFLDTNDNKPKILSLVDISSIFNKDLHKYMENNDISEEVGEA
jgi:hypothetical protein